MEQEIEQTTAIDPFDVNDFFRVSIWQSKFARGRVHYQTVKHGVQHLLGSAMVKLTGNEDILEYPLAREDDVPVSLLQLLRDLPTLPEMSAILGVAEDGAPLLVDLRASESAHILIAGEAGAGKTMLLRSLLLSLAIRQRQALVQTVLLDGSPEPELAPLAELPHALGPAVSELDAVAETLNFLVYEMSYRQEQGVKTPALVVAIDEIENLLEAGGQPIVAALMRLLQKGAPAGIHLLLTSAAPAAPLLDNVLKAAIPLRIVGHLADAGAARAAAGVGHSQAEYLQGQGDFIAITGDTMTPFQGAYVGDRVARRLIQQLRRDSGEKLLAFPIDPVTGQVLDTEQSDTPGTGGASIAGSAVEEEPVVAAGAEPRLLHEGFSWADAVGEDAKWEEDESDSVSEDIEPEEPEASQLGSISPPRMISRSNWSAQSKPQNLSPINGFGGADDEANASEEELDLAAAETETGTIELEYEDDEDYGTDIVDEDDEIPFE